jgi:hypothetical protein
MEEHENVNPKSAHGVPVPCADVGGDLSHLKRFRQEAGNSGPHKGDDAASQVNSVCAGEKKEE